MKAVIERKEYSDKQVLGDLTLYDDNNSVVFTCKTLELPWRNNESKVSCIPTNTYRAIYRGENEGSGKYGKHYRILQADGKTEVPGRSFILIHSGNHFWDIKGCILVGVSHQDINKDGYNDVTGSRPTMVKLVELVGTAGFDLEIKGAQPDFNTLLSKTSTPINTSLKEGDIVKVTASQLNLRKEANGTADVITKVAANTQLEVVECQGAWALVSTPTTKGWVMGTFVEERGSLGEVTKGPLNIRTEASPTAALAGKPLVVGTRLTIKAEKNGWLQVQTQGTQGFAASAYLKKV
jgi:SH3-like domain-containing protein